jgi:hypothetical protein
MDTHPFPGFWEVPVRERKGIGKFLGGRRKKRYLEIKEIAFGVKTSDALSQRPVPGRALTWRSWPLIIEPTTEK